jgi:beta-N-acetylhexosaminidase
MRFRVGSNSRSLRHWLWSGCILALLTAGGASAEEPGGETVLQPNGKITVTVDAESRADVTASTPTGNISPEQSFRMGRMLIVGFHGQQPEDPGVKAVIRQLRKGELGGVIFFKRNIDNRPQVQALTALFRKAAGNRPILIGIDQEGGRIQRLSAADGVAPLASARSMAGRATPAEAEAAYGGLAADLKGLGFNINFGPVVDLDTHPRNPIIGALGRAYSAKPDVVAAYAAAFVKGHRQQGMLTAAKHFPGHGSGDKDSHLGPVDVSKSWTEAELEPYRQLDAENLIDMVMVGHLRLARFDKKNMATFSPIIIDKVLRGSLGKETIVISDDMEMGAITKLMPKADAMLAAVKAGNDLVIVSAEHDKNPAMAAELFRKLQTAAADDETIRLRIDQTNQRLSKRFGTAKAPAKPRKAAPGAIRPLDPL